jgi:hypothetical protein
MSAKEDWAGVQALQENVGPHTVCSSHFTGLGIVQGELKIGKLLRP